GPPACQGSKTVTNHEAQVEMAGSAVSKYTTSEVSSSANPERNSTLLAPPTGGGPSAGRTVPGFGTAAHWLVDSRCAAPAVRLRRYDRRPLPGRQPVVVQCRLRQR